MTNTQLARTPIEYEPTFTEKGKYEDQIKNYTWTDFAERGIKCPCYKNSKTIHRNKHSFTFQHCKSKKHIDYLEKLNKDPGVNNSIKKQKDYEKTIKQQKIQIGKEHQNYLLEKRRNETLQSQIKLIISEKEEAISQIKQTSNYIDDVTKENDQLKNKIAEYENITNMLIKLAGYELDDEN